MLKKIMNSLIDSGMILVIGNFINQGIVFISAPMFSQIMSTNDFGLFSAFSAFVSIIQIIMTLNIHSSIYNAKLDYSEQELKVYVRNCILFVIICGISISCLMIILSPLIENIFQINYFSIIIACIYTTVYCIYITINSYLIANKDNKKCIVLASIVTFVFSIVNICVSLLLVLFLKENKYLGRSFGMLVGIIVATSIMFIFLRKEHVITTKNIIQHFTRDIKYGLSISIPLIFHSLSSIVLGKMDQLMLLNLVSSSSAGIYAYGNNFSHIFSTICQAFNTIYLPWYLLNKQKNNEEKILKESKKYIKFIFIIYVLFNLFIPEVFVLISNKEYYSALGSIQIILIGMFFNYLYYFIVSFETYHKKTKYIAIGTILSGVVNILFNALLIPKYNEIGAAIATSISLFFLYVFHLAISSFLIKEKFEFSIRKMTICGILAFGVSITCIFLSKYSLIRIMIGFLITGIIIFKMYKKGGSKMKKLIIIGAGGYAKSVVDSIDYTNYEVVGFIDEFSKEKEHLGINIIAHSLEEIQEKEKYYYFIAIGNNQKRKRWFDKLRLYNLKLINIIDKSAIVSSNASIGIGCFVGKFAVINSKASIGDNTIINTRALVEHGCNVGNHCNLSTNTVINGDVVVGEGSFIGSLSVTIGQLIIGSWSTVGAGAVVIENVGDNITVAGVPARIIKEGAMLG